MLNNPNELVSYRNNQLVTNSLLVAQKFQKRHDSIIRSVKNLVDNSPQKCGQLFVSTFYTDPSGKGNSMYVMNRDGFSLLVMGFTGKDALDFKLEFIEAFNKMEQKLKKVAKPLSQLEILQQSVGMLVEQERRLNTVENEVLELKAKTATRPDYFTIVGYGTLHHVSVNLKQASSLGRRATELCKARNLETDKIPDPRFGEVKMYPASVLDEVFNQSLTGKGGAL